MQHALQYFLLKRQVICLVSWLLISLPGCAQSWGKFYEISDACKERSSNAQLRVYLATTTFNGNLGGIAGADNSCNINANKPATGTYKALLADGVLRRACSSPNCTSFNENVDWVFKPATTYYRTDGVTEIGKTNCAGVFEFPLAISFSAGASAFFTGLQANWTTGTACTGNWTVAGGSASYGSANATTSAAILNSTGAVCTSGTMAIMCVEQ